MSIWAEFLSLYGMGLVLALLFLVGLAVAILATFFIFFLVAIFGAWLLSLVTPRPEDPAEYGRNHGSMQAPIDPKPKN